MIPVKLVETVFHRLWAILLPVVLVPLLVIALTRQADEFQSEAVVWVSSPVADSSTAIGYNNPYQTPAQNQAQVLNDLLSTEAFRIAVVKEAGVVSEGASIRDTRRAANDLVIVAASSGVNLVSITGTADSAKEAQAVVTAAINQYLNRATAEIQRDSTVSAEYYKQQMTLVQQTLEQRRTELSAYLKANPKAADPRESASLEPAYRTLVDQVDTQSKLLDSLQTSLQAVQLREAAAPQTQQASFNLQDAPTLPEAPIPTALTTRLGLPLAGVMFGFLIGFAYIYLAYRTDHTIRTAADLAAIEVPLLGSVPQLQSTSAWLRFTPLGWYLNWRRKDFARRTAASITSTNLVKRQGGEAS